MNFDFTDREEAFRKEVRGWLEANLPDDLRGRAFASSRADREEVRKLRAWQKRMCEAGYVGLDWPREFGGRGATIVEMVILYQEMARAESPQLVNRGGVSMLGPTLMKHGTAAQQMRFLARILTADELWCQGFSEPNAGSDLANLQTRAVREGDHFVVNGQKVWTSMAHVADWCFLLVRTDPIAAKHKGISFLLVDMRTPGITVRPLRQLTGEAEFNEVFFDNVRVPAENLVGKLNEGWSVAITTLAYERDILTFIRHISLRNALHRLVRLVQQQKRGTDPIIRQKLAALWIGEQALQLNGYRSLTNILRGGAPGPEGSTSKLFWSQIDQELAHVATEVIGPYAQIPHGSSWAPDGGQWEVSELLGRGRGPHAGGRAERARRQEQPLGGRPPGAEDARDGGQAGHRHGQRTRRRRRHGHVRHVRHARGRGVGPFLHGLRPRRPRAGRRLHVFPAAPSRRRQGARALVDRGLHRGAGGPPARHRAARRAGRAAEGCHLRAGAPDRRRSPDPDPDDQAARLPEPSARPPDAPRPCLLAHVDRAPDRRPRRGSRGVQGEASAEVPGPLTVAATSGPSGSGSSARAADPRRRSRAFATPSWSDRGGAALPRRELRPRVRRRRSWSWTRSSWSRRRAAG